MNFFNRIKDSWMNLGLTQKITAGATAAGLVAVVAILLVWANRPNMELLYGGLSNEDMTQIVSVVQASGVDYKTTETGNGIQVNREAVHKLRMTLATQGLPSDSHVGLELFGNDTGKLGVSDFEQRINRTRAIQGELSRTISSLKGVKNARVLIVEPDTRLIKTNPNEKPKASVFIDTGNQTLEDTAVNGIRFLVANAIEGVALKDVAVVDNHGKTLTEKFLDDGILGGAGGSARFLRQIEADYSKKVETMLERVLGAGNVVARVAVELDMENVTIVDQEYDPRDKGTLVKRLMHDQDSLNTKERALGDNGIGANPNLPGGGSPPGTVDDIPISQTEEERESETTEYIVGSTVTETVRKPGGMKFVTASVMVGSEDINGQPLNNDLKELESIVAHALGLRRDATGTSYVNGSVEIAERVFPRPGQFPVTFDEKWSSFLSNYSPLINSIIGVLVAIAVLITFFKVMKKFRSQDQPEVEIIDDTLDDEQAAALLEAGQSTDGSSDLMSVLTPELLNELIQERSENVGSALRSWVNAK